MGKWYYGQYWPRLGLYLLVLLLCSRISGQSNFQFNAGVGNVFKITTNQSGVCSAPTPFLKIYPSTGFNLELNPTFTRDFTPPLQEALAGVLPGKYYKAKAGVPITINVELTKSKRDTLIGGNRGTLSYRALNPIFGRMLNNSTYEHTFLNTPIIQEDLDKGNFDVKVTFTKPSLTPSWIFIPLVEDLFVAVTNITQSRTIYLLLPVVVEGLLDTEVPILGQVIEPQVPYMVLHDPPGDGSFTEFQKTETTCRSLETTAATDESISSFANVKLGVKGTIGIVVAVDYEIYAEIKGSGGKGSVQIESNSTETCLTVTEGYSTSGSNTIKDGADVFFGYGMTSNYGVFRQIVADTKTCQAKLDTGLAYQPIPESITPFFYTRENILSEMARLEQITKDTVNSRTKEKIKARNLAQNQIDVWQQVLKLNDDNKNNAKEVLHQSVGFSGGAGPIFRESTIEVTDSRSITTEQYIDASIGLDVVVNVGGSGFSGGFEYKTQKRFGETKNQSGTKGQTVRYTLQDQDPGDVFQVDVLRDPMFGTPVFKVKTGSRSSCPYEGGYQRDQPKLKHRGQSTDRIVSLSNPIGASATFRLDLCNESNEPRTYNLKLNAQSNLNGAVVSAAGVPLNGNDLGQTFTIPANSCVGNLLVDVRQLSPSSPLSYPNLELFLYAPCEEGIQSSVFASIYFGNATTGTKDLGDASLLSVFPNPTNSQLQVKLLSNNPIESFQLSDLTGKILRHSNQKMALQQVDLDLSTLPKGLYVLQVRSGERVYAQKVMLQ